MNDDYFHTCRYCKYFEKGVCTNEQVFNEVDNDNVLYPFWEDGTLSEAIQEGFCDKNPFKDVENKLSEFGISAKRRKEIMQTLMSELEDAKLNWTESIDESVSNALNGYDFHNLNGVPITDPTEMFCKFYW